jgi:hypothetical protein
LTRTLPRRAIAPARDGRSSGDQRQRRGPIALTDWGIPRTDIGVDDCYSVTDVMGAVLARLLVVLDNVVGVTPTQFAQSWAAEDAAAVLGSASVRPAAEGAFLPGLVELVVIPLTVNVASSALYDLVRGLVRRSQPEGASAADLAVVEVQTRDGDRVVVVRMQSGGR